MNTLLKLLGPWLLKQLARVLDPGGAARAQALLDRGRALDAQEADAAAKEKLSQAAYRASVERCAVWDQKLAESHLIELADEQSLKDSRERIKRIADDLAKNKADLARSIAALSDHDAVRSYLL